MKLSLLLSAIFSSVLVAFSILPAAAQSSMQQIASVQSPSSVRVGLPVDFYHTFSHGFAEANGIRLHYVVGGPQDGEMVILLHGWPQTWYTWRWVMPALAAAGYRVVAVDCR